MTLFRQIALLTSLCFMFLIVSILWNNLEQTRAFVQGQLQTSAQDTATTLGISIANVAPDQNIASIETLINATFDSGHYSQIELISTSGKVLLNKKRATFQLGIPYWFLSFVPLEAAKGVSQIIQGWQPYGTIHVTLHPEFVYQTLYSNLKNSLFWGSVIAVLSLLILWVLLKLLLKPLIRVQQQAESIQRNEFIILEDIPKTKELRQVVLATNKMIDKVRQFFDEQTQLLQRYQDLKFKDEDTGLSNRLHFVTKIDDICKDETASNGVLVAIRIKGFGELCEKEGFDGAKAILASLTNITHNSIKELNWSLFGRLKKAEFALYLPGTIENAESIINNIFEQFEQQTCINCDRNYLCLYAGALTIKKGDTTGKVLSEMDLVVTQAETAGRFSLQKSGHDNKNLPIGKKDWRQRLLKAIIDERFFVVGQSVYNKDKSELHKELYVRLRDDKSKPITAGVFMPVASSLGLDHEIDKVVLSMAQNLDLKAEEAKLAINISESFLVKADAFTELLSFIDRCAATNKILYIEITHMVFNRNIEIVKLLSEKLNSVGYSLGVDNLDLNISIDLLRDIQPHYVKMNAKQLTNMAENGVSAGVQALLTLVNGLDIKLIAVGIDSKEMHNQMKEIGVDAMQGHYYGKFIEF